MDGASSEAGSPRGCLSYRASAQGSSGQLPALLGDGGAAGQPVSTGLPPPAPPEARQSLLKELSRRRLGLLHWGGDPAASSARADATPGGSGYSGGGGSPGPVGPTGSADASLDSLTPRALGLGQGLAAQASGGSGTLPSAMTSQGWEGSPSPRDDDAGSWPVSVEVRAPSPLGAFHLGGAGDGGGATGDGGGAASDPGAAAGRPHRASTGSGPRRTSVGALGRGVRALLRFGSMSAARPGGGRGGTADGGAPFTDGGGTAAGAGWKDASDGGGAEGHDGHPLLPGGGVCGALGGPVSGLGWDPTLGPFAAAGGGRVLQSLQSIHPGGGSKSLLHFPSGGPVRPADSLLTGPASSIGHGAGSGAPGAPGDGSGLSAPPGPPPGAGKPGKRPPAARSDDLLRLAMESQQAQAVRIVVDALVAGRFSRASVMEHLYDAVQAFVHEPQHRRLCRRLLKHLPMVVRGLSAGSKAGVRDAPRQKPRQL
jgi:hypothetical protein